MLCYEAICHQWAIRVLGASLPAERALIYVNVQHNYCNLQRLAEQKSRLHEVSMRRNTGKPKENRSISERTLSGNTRIPNLPTGYTMGEAQTGQTKPTALNPASEIEPERYRRVYSPRVFFRPCAEHGPCLETRKLQETRSDAGRCRFIAATDRGKLRAKSG